ncbi:unnamed protein product [Adineta steineri]|uniref:Uncharacterized protein n=1 Tax=Adineta steineri TaxID=433720 RepID=A0A816AS05_9BILA|nr:unnamed protein product [Adineta steineri]CAF1600032.1 unnamed protein product [Adineta steineri]
MIVVKRPKTRLNDLSDWNDEKCLNNNNNEVKSIDDEERSIAFSVKLLLKNQKNFSSNLLRSSSHDVISSKCQCQRSFHIFCTDLFHENDSDIKMINSHPTSYYHNKRLSNRISTPYRKYRHEIQEENNPNTTFQIPSKVSSRTNPNQRSIQTPTKYSSSIRLPKQLQPRAQSVFDQSHSESEIFLPRTPPSSPKTPRQESTLLPLHFMKSAPLQSISITPHIRYVNEDKKKSTTISSSKLANYEDYAREYLSKPDCTNEIVDKDINEKQSTMKPKLSLGTQSTSRPRTGLSIRLLSHIANRYSDITKYSNSTLNIPKNCTEKSRRILKSKTRSMNEHNDVSKKESIPPSKSVFGFSKTASSMHFGYAADRLGLQASFEKWPRPPSHRTSMERKHEVTTLRLVTLPLVTS